MIGMRKESDGFRGGVSCMLNMNLKETFKKQGGMKLLEQYWKNGSLLTAVSYTHLTLPTIRLV